MKKSTCFISTVLFALAAFFPALAQEEGSGDPQLKTNHPWFQGELSCSTFERLFKTQAAQYKRATGRDTNTDEDKALASFYWRETHFFHCSLIPEPNIRKPGKYSNAMTNSYWETLFSYGHSQCNETHHQWPAEFEYLLGHCRARAVTVAAHCTHEVFLTGGHYGKGKWVALDQDISTVCFDPAQKKMMSIQELVKAGHGGRVKLLSNRSAASNRGWLPELAKGDGVGTYKSIRDQSLLPGFAGAPPMVYLRPGERLRRFPKPGLGEGEKGIKVYWGKSPDGVEGPNRHKTWTSAPQDMFNARKRRVHEGAAKRGRFGNARFVYKPNFKDKSYKAGIAAEDDQSVTFEHCSPFIIATKPVNKKCFAPGGKLGLVLNGKASCKVSVSLDAMKTWKEPVDFSDGLDLTDTVKGHYQYWLKFHAPAGKLSGKDLTITTTCMANGYTMPHLKSGGTDVTFNAANQAYTSIGPQYQSIKNSLVAGAIEKPSFTVEMKTPGGEKVKGIYFMSWNASWTKPGPDIVWKAEYSVDGSSWKVLKDDWRIKPLVPYKPRSTWSQSYFFGGKEIEDKNDGTIQIRISNNKGRPYMTGRFWLVYEVKKPSRTKVTFCWNEKGTEKKAEHIYPAGATMDTSWKIKNGANPVTKWIEMEPVP